MRTFLVLVTFIASITAASADATKNTPAENAFAIGVAIAVFFAIAIVLTLVAHRFLPEAPPPAPVDPNQRQQSHNDCPPLIM